MNIYYGRDIKAIVLLIEFIFSEIFFIFIYEMKKFSLETLIMTLKNFSSNLIFEL